MPSASRSSRSSSGSTRWPMRELQTPKHEARDAEGDVIEDRRGTTPFIKEMSMDAQKTVSRMIGVTQLLKHKRGGKEQAQLIQQLTAQARRLTPRSATCRTGFARDRDDARATEHRPRITDPPRRRGVGRRGGARRPDRGGAGLLSIDRQRTEQIVQALLRSASDRTPTGKTITVRLLRDKQGAMIVVEEPEAVSEAALSPMVRRLAEVQGGSAKVADREGGGTSFQVFLPATDLRRRRRADGRAGLVRGETRRRARTGLGGSEPLGQGRAGASESSVSSRRASSSSRHAPQDQRVALAAAAADRGATEVDPGAASRAPG